MSTKLLNLLRDGSTNGVSEPSRRAIYAELYNNGHHAHASSWRDLSPLQPKEMTPPEAVKSFTALLEADGVIQHGAVEQSTASTAASGIGSQARPLPRGTRLTKEQTLARYCVTGCPDAKDILKSNWTCEVRADNQPGHRAMLRIHFNDNSHIDRGVLRWQDDSASATTPTTAATMSAATTDQSADDFASLVRSKLALGMAKSKAIYEARQENPRAFAQWLQTGGSANFDTHKPATEAEQAPAVAQTFNNLVESNINSGMTKTAAVKAAIASNPAEYSAWLASGGSPHFGSSIKAEELKAVGDNQ